jgi:hypothetical protein
MQLFASPFKARNLRSKPVICGQALQPGGAGKKLIKAVE